MAKPLERTSHASTSSDELLLAPTATLKFKASLGYTLSVSYHPNLVNAPNEITFDAGGDLEGEGRVVLSAPSDGHTQMDIDWRVRPTSRWMTALSPIAAPAFTYAHTALMRRGEDGLREYLARQNTTNNK